MKEFPQSDLTMHPLLRGIGWSGIKCTGTATVVRCFQEEKCHKKYEEMSPVLVTMLLFESYDLNHRLS